MDGQEGVGVLDEFPDGDFGGRDEEIEGVGCEGEDFVGEFVVFFFFCGLAGEGSHVCFSCYVAVLMGFVGAVGLRWLVTLT